MNARPDPVKMRTCPSCKARFLPKDEGRHLPFCSARCKMADLGRWLGGEYSVPTDEVPSEEAYVEVLRERDRDTH